MLSLWAGGMDDPLRLTVDGDKLFARIEAQRVFTTKGVPVGAGRWRHVAAVKAGARLALYLDGQLQETIEVPAALNTAARVCALGGNPNYSATSSWPPISPTSSSLSAPWMPPKSRLEPGNQSLPTLRTLQSDEHEASPSMNLPSPDAARHPLPIGWGEGRVRGLRQVHGH